MSSRPRRLVRVLVAFVGATAVVVSTGATAFAAAPSGARASAANPVADPAALATLRAEVADGTLARTHGSYSGCAAFGCRSTVVTVAPGSRSVLRTAAPVGWGATDLQRAFRLTDAPNSKRLVVIVGVGADANLESDLNIYRAAYGIAPCTRRNGCLTIRDYKGGPALQPCCAGAEESIGVETSLDVQMVSAACPTCHITYLGVPVKVNNDVDIRDFGIATKTAVHMGAAAESISYGFNTNSDIDNGPLSRAMVQPGLGLFSATGDYGYMPPNEFQTSTGGWPQNLRSVVSVGGTTMTKDQSSPTGFDQQAWRGAGSGCAPDLTAAYGQPKKIAGYCNGHRAVSDVSAVADNLAVYDTYAPASGHPYGWITVGGTSASSPFLAGLAARAPRVNDALGPNVIYRAPADAFDDITVGRNGTHAQCAADHVAARLCRTAPGWDGATGRGIPRGLAPFES